MSIIKDKYYWEVITTCHSKQNIWPIKIKSKDYNYPLIFTRAYATYQKVVIINDIVKQPIQ